MLMMKIAKSLDCET